ncbi:MAG: TIGR01777 family oxidoreductase [Gemmatimonadaceae bacterium]|nr:TIGR01777 family oxidoreductase [Gemmatimonadaceae bacterium]
MATVVVTGASGMIGRALVRALRTRGDVVRTIGRAPGDDAKWSDDDATLDRVLADATAVVHLAGAPIAVRWTSEVKRTLRESRVQTTARLAARLAAHATPGVLLSASAIGIYGDRRDAWLDETSAPGDGFLVELAQAWEDAAEPAAQDGWTVTTLRTGIVLGTAGGALAKLLPVFRLGAGGPLGDGRHWMSWIGATDTTRALLHLLDHPVTGPVNLVAPTPVTNAEFTTTLGRALHRPALIPVPRFALAMVYGEMADATLFASQRVRPRVLAASGFTWAAPTLAEALTQELRA